MAHLAMNKLKAAKIETSPFMYTIIPGFLSPEMVSRINATYPKIEAARMTPGAIRDAEGALIYAAAEETRLL